VEGTTNAFPTVVVVNQLVVVVVVVDQLVVVVVVVAVVVDQLVVVVVDQFVVDGQEVSSVPSPQSFSPSHLHFILMQAPSPHVNWS
jgi:hypothetical protein